MKKRKKHPPRHFTKAEIAALKRSLDKWRKQPQIAAMLEAIGRSTQITADDLKIIVR